MAPVQQWLFRRSDQSLRLLRYLVPGPLLCANCKPLIAESYRQRPHTLARGTRTISCIVIVTRRCQLRGL